MYKKKRSSCINYGQKPSRLNIVMKIFYNNNYICSCPSRPEDARIDTGAAMYTPFIDQSANVLD